MERGSGSWGWCGTSLTIRVDAGSALRELEATPQRLAKVIVEWLGRGSQLAKNEMQNIIKERQKSPQHAGGLASSVQTSVGSASATIQPTKAYAQFVDQPTRPHVIEARPGGVLAFPHFLSRVGNIGGRGRSVFKFGGKEAVSSLVFVQRVHHPGTRGMHFIQGTAERVEEPLTALFQDMVDRELARGGAS